MLHNQESYRSCIYMYVLGVPIVPLFFARFFDWILELFRKWSIFFSFQCLHLICLYQYIYIYIESGVKHNQTYSICFITRMLSVVCINRFITWSHDVPLNDYIEWYFLRICWCFDKPITVFTICHRWVIYVNT